MDENKTERLTMTVEEAGEALGISRATAFTAGKAINKTDELAKFLTERLKLIQKEAKQLLGL